MGIAVSPSGADLRSDSRHSRRCQSVGRLSPQTKRRRRSLDLVHALRHHAQLAELWRQADFTWMGITGGQLYALPMISSASIGIVYCATRPGPRTEVGPAATLPPRVTMTSASVIERCEGDRRGGCGVRPRPGERDARRRIAKRQPARAIVAADRAGLAISAKTTCRRRARSFPRCRRYESTSSATFKRIRPQRSRLLRRRAERRPARAGAALSKAATEARKELAVSCSSTFRPWSVSAARPPSAEGLAETLRSQPGLRLEGMMAIGPAHRRPRRNLSCI